MRVTGGECHLAKKKKAAGYVSSYQHKCKTFAGESTVGRGNHDIQLSGALVAESHWLVNFSSFLFRFVSFRVALPEFRAGGNHVVRKKDKS